MEEPAEIALYLQRLRSLDVKLHERNAVEERRDATGEHLKEVDTAISKARGARDKIEKEFAAARSASDGRPSSIQQLVISCSP